MLHERDDHGLLPIHRATIKAPASVVHLLIQAGADLEARFEGLASMHIACGRGLEGVVDVLLAGGANRDALTAQGFTPLHCASGRGGLGAVKALLTAGANVNVRSGGWQRRTPLHAAATLGDKAVTEELLRWGADVDLPDTEGVTSLHIGTFVPRVILCTSWPASRLPKCFGPDGAAHPSQHLYLNVLDLTVQCTHNHIAYRFSGHKLSFFTGPSTQPFTLSCRRGQRRSSPVSIGGGSVYGGGAGRHAQQAVTLGSVSGILWCSHDLTAGAGVRV